MDNPIIYYIYIYIIYIIEQLLALHNRTQTTVRSFAVRSACSHTTIKRVTGHSVTSYIDRHTIPIIKSYLDDERLSLTQIADRMHSTSLSYFSRYCTKHLGLSPSEYRLSLQPK